MQDPGKKLDDIYCKYILPYDTLSQVEREELLRLVEEEHEEANKRKLERSRNEGDSDEDEDDEDDEEDDECVVKGKSTSLSQFYRTGAKVMGMIFKVRRRRKKDNDVLLNNLQLFSTILLIYYLFIINLS